MRETYFTPLDRPELNEVDANYLPANVQVHFEFGAHEHADDFAAPAALLKECDIFIPELVGWSENDLTWFNRVSRSHGHNFKKLLRNRLSPLRNGRVDFDEYLSSMVNELQGQNKTVLFVDAPQGSNLAEIGEITIDAGIGTSSAETALGDVYNFSHTMLQASVKRDEVILNKLGPAVTEAVAAHPKLQAKPTVKVLVTLGAQHERVYGYLSDSSYTTDKVSASYGTSYGKDSVGLRIEEIHKNILDGRPLSYGEVAELLISTFVDGMIERRPAGATLDRRQFIEKRNTLFRFLQQDITKGAGELVCRLSNRNQHLADLQKIDEYAEKAGI